MIAAARPFSASGAGESLARLAIALRAMPLFGPSFAGRSKSTVSTLAFVRCAAICAPMTPAPSTAALRMRNGVAVIVISIGAKDRPRSARGRGVRNGRVAQASGCETDQVVGGGFAVIALVHVALALDDAEVGHGVGQRAGDDVQAPVNLFLGQARQQPAEFTGELAQHVAVVLGEELAQGLVVFGVGPGEDTDEGGATAVIAGQVERR